MADCKIIKNYSDIYFNTIFHYNFSSDLSMEDDPPQSHRLQRQKSGCKNPFVPFKSGVKDDMTNFEPLQTLQERDHE